MTSESREHEPLHWQTLRELAGDTSAPTDPTNEPASFFDSPSRRDFLKLLGATVALSGLAGCTRQPREAIVPYVRQPERLVPGKPLFFATAMAAGGGALGLLVESHEGRPTKVEGNPDHPASRGGTDVFAQASVMTLYDPDRSQVVTHAGQISSWDAWVEAIARELGPIRRAHGDGLRLLTEPVTSPALAQQIHDLLDDLPRARWHHYEPSGRHSAIEGARLAFGRRLQTLHRFDRAEVVLAIDVDFLSCGPASVRYASDFAARRLMHLQGGNTTRLYLVESTPSATAALADHRLPLRPTAIEAFTRALARRLGVLSGRGDETLPAGVEARFVDALARDLRAHHGSSLVVAGNEQSAAVHALAQSMNQALGNVGATVVHIDPVEATPEPADPIDSMRELLSDIAAGRVSALIVLGGNPVYTAPVDFDFPRALLQVPFRLHLSLYEDETSALCHWHVPEAHFLESWSDAVAFDGTASIVQPLIAPLYGGKSPHEVVAALSGTPSRTAHDVVRDYWRARSGAGDFEAFWRKALHDGLVDGTASAPRSVALVPDFETALPEPAAPADEGTALDLAIRLDPTVQDGRFANNGWLQELPKPVTKLTWDNAALVSPATAERLKLENEDVVELRHGGRSVEAPIWIVPGHADDTFTVHLGYGRTRAGRVGNGAGFDAYVLRTSTTPWFGRGIQVRKTGSRQRLACTQGHFRLEGRGLVRSVSLESYRKDDAFIEAAARPNSPGESLYSPREPSEHAWGMVIDLGACHGCNACVVACQSENNVPVVGKDQVLRGREMHWLRIDRYYSGSASNPDSFNQPLPCMHCESAPCEVVCPVGATLHDAEGLNEMVYNRCVGTRYCSNNCPYKVRRFNFYHYTQDVADPLKMLMNPNVTVRSRGVMEKCTYCVQRIEAARIQAKLDDRPMRDGDVVTACEAACPARAITFGDIHDPASRAAKLRADRRSFGILAELNTRPRTTYLAMVRNPNPEIESS
ncbi:MAG: 4Fe-4S dicluster domain-containing protein [Planctomycetes bacterium]|nr:4Fe-4S dicluster domain-containing protein [Planctomycetota bacterium]